MPLVSRLFKDDDRLQACLKEDSKHVTRGARGDFVSRIQTAVLALGTVAISGHELVRAEYGPSTADAVLHYKRARKIINFAYQKTADDIVGKMTIKKLDEDMAKFEARAAAANIPV